MHPTTTPVLSYLEDMSSKPTKILFLTSTVITGNETESPFVADVLIEDGFIAKIGVDLDSTVDKDVRRIDASGHFLSPGFIDMHAHSDLYLLTRPEHEAKITQGCTVRF